MYNLKYVSVCFSSIFININNINKLSKWTNAGHCSTNRTLDTRNLNEAAIRTYPHMQGGALCHLSLSAKQKRCKIKSGGPLTAALTAESAVSGPRLDPGHQTPQRGSYWDISTYAGRCPLPPLTVG